MNEDEMKQLDWEKQNGLIPAVIQDCRDGAVLMLGYMNEESLKKTIETQLVTFYSRTKNELWTKGETSGNFLELVHISRDCDADSLLILVRPQGPVCHNGTKACFENHYPVDWQIINELQDIISDRDKNRPRGSYTTHLLDSGMNKIAQKVGEEAFETVIAALNEDNDSFAREAADLIYHLVVLLYSRDLYFYDVIDVIRQRMSAKRME